MRQSAANDMKSLHNESPLGDSCEDTMTATGYSIDDEQSHEDAPLLQNGSLHRTTSRSHASFIHQTHSPRVIILILFTILFILAFGGFLMAVPGLRLYENIICHHYYNKLEGEQHIGLDSDIDESLCKVDEVQNELNVLLAVLHFLGAIPALLMTVPYGLLADRIGRKPVFVLSLTGMILSASWSLAVLWFWKVLPVRLVWLCPIFIIIGGGEAVTAMMFYAIGFDITTESNRANTFLLGKLAGVVAEVIAPTVASFLMLKSPWIAYIMGLGLLAFGTSLVIFIPETAHRPSEREPHPESSSEHSYASKQGKAGLFKATKRQIADAFRRIYGATTVLHSLPILLLLLTFLSEPVGRQSMDLSLRYISKRFSWALRETGFLVSLRAFVKTVLLLVVLPSLSYYLTERLHFSSKVKDLSLARYSAVMLFVGALTFAASPTIGLTVVGLVIYTLGEGFGSLTRSLITTFVDKEHVARLYSAITIVEVVTSLAAGPSIAALYTAGLKLKGPWLALPFYVLAFVCFVGGLGVWCFGLLSKKQEEIPFGDEDHEAIFGNTVFLQQDTTGASVINPV